MGKERKKIAVVFNRMVVGGAEKALINFLHALDKEKYDVTLFTFSNQGAYYSQLPTDIKIVFTGRKNPKSILKTYFRNLEFLKILKSIFWRIFIRILKDDFKKFACTMMCYPECDEEFDCVIAYKLRYEDVMTALFKIKASKRCVWVHGKPIDVGQERKIEHFIQKYFVNWVNCHFQKFFVVSKNLVSELRDICPASERKTEIFHNFIDEKDIMQKAQEKVFENLDNKICIVTVGRLQPVKGQIVIPKVAKYLNETGYEFIWYIIGDGSLYKMLEDEVKKQEVQDEVVLLGTKDNPYPYIKACDIYVQTSLNEGFGLTVAEAKILHKPIVTTDAGVMSEQIKDGETGIIVQEATAEALFHGIKTLIERPEMRERFVKNLENEKYDTSKEMQKLYDFIEN